MEEIHRVEAVTVYPSSFSVDGRFLSYVVFHRSPSQALILDLESGVSTPIEEDGASAESRFSPDGRWLAYSSNVSGNWEVYLKRAPTFAGKWQASAAGGRHPRWSDDGSELFFASDGGLTAVTVRGETSPTLGPPREVLDARYRLDSARYDVADDGRRFLILRDEEDQGTEGSGALEAEIVVVLNWSRELERLTPADSSPKAR